MKKLNFEKLLRIEHSGQGDNATHLQVIKAFENSIEEGTNYCNQRGWKVEHQNGILNITSNAPFGFQFSAIVTEQNINECYIDYLDSKNKFKQTRKEFKTFGEAKNWMLENFEKPNIDFIKYY